MNGIQVTKPAEQQWNQLLHSVVIILKYKKIKTYHAIYIKVFSDGSVSYLKVSNDDFLNTTNKEIEFTEITKGFI